MATTRCVECHASIPVPAELAATTMTCPYCHRAQAVPDLETRRRLLLDEQREARLAEQARAEEAREARREAREERERREEKQEAKRGRWGMRLLTLCAILLAPTIIAITVFDLPARLGFGASGSDRLGQMKAQLEGTGCTVVRGISSEYATSNVSKLVAVPAGGPCIRVFAAGGDGHGSLSLRLFGPDGKQLAASGNATTDPQLTHCARAPATLRYEIKVGPASKGRLSSMVLACPPAR
jgi:hypothetical protein